MTSEVGALMARRRASHRAAASPSIARMATLFAGLVMLVFALPPFFSFPWLGFWLVPLAAIYLLMLLLLPRMWLIVLPLATVGLDITPFTGRFAYNELDLLFLLTIASGLLYGRYRFKVFAPGLASALLLAYLTVMALGYSGWSFFVLPPRAGLDNPYYSSEYAYKVFKGMIWGIALVPMWGHLLAADKPRAVKMLVTGMCCAALLLGIVVLWERGTLGVLLSGSAWYHLASSLLDLTSSYRVTGIFSDMHTGGEAFDGVVLLLLPASLYALVNGRVAWLRILGAAGFLALAYATLVGFTRATYAAFAIGLLVYGGLTLLSRRRNGVPLPVSVPAVAAALGLGLIAAAIAYRFAGSFGLAVYGALVLLAYAANRWLQLPRTRLLAPLLAAGLVTMAVSAHFNSRWVEPSVVMAVSLGISLPASYFVAHRLFAQWVTGTETNRLLVLGAIMFLPMIFALASGGYQINDRVSRVAGDLETRGDHWREVIDSAGNGFFSGLLGNGVGSFPANYIGAHPEMVRNVGSFRVVSENNRDILRMGGGNDLMLGQRVTIEPFTNYTVTVHLRATQAARLVIALCERNLIYASNFMPNCVTRSMGFAATDSAFAQQTLEMNSQRVGESRSLWRWPTVLMVKYDKPDTVVEIDALELSADGFNVLRNGSFKRGLDYWFSYNDFSHLPWHVKNTFLQVWFESGWLGLGLFLALLALLVRANFMPHTYDSLVPVYTTAVLTVCLFGLFGSPLDSARVSWIFYFFLAAGLAKLRSRNNSRSTSPAISGRHRKGV